MGVPPSPYRARECAGRPLADQWGKEQVRPYFAAGSFMGAGGAAWRQVPNSEAGVAAGDISVNLLWNFVEYCEALPLQQVLSTCVQRNIPLGVRRVAIR
eukprot:3171060-Pyramimonas_sp.AAC.1